MKETLSEWQNDGKDEEGVGYRWYPDRALRKGNVSRRELWLGDDGQD
jgi:hypothetical protein